MTTIVWDGYTLAADRCRTNGMTKELAKKLFECGDYVYGAVGDMHDAPVVARWLGMGAPWVERPTFEESGTLGIVVRRPRPGVELALYIVGGKTATLTEIPPGPTATGSGMDFALAALACGKDARGALEIAAALCAVTAFGCDAVDVVPRPGGYRFPV